MSKKLGWRAAIVAFLIIQHYGVNPVFLGDLQGFADLVEGKIMFQQRRDVSQIAAVRVTGDEVAAANQAAYHHLADHAGSHVPIAFAFGFEFGFWLALGQQGFGFILSICFVH